VQADLAKQPRSFWRRHPWLVWLGGGALLAIAALAIAVAVLVHRAEPYLRARIVTALSEHFHARVELDSFHVSLGNGIHGEWGVWARGRGLRIWPPALVAGVHVPPSNAPSEPLIQLGGFGFHVPLRYQPGAPVYIGQVRLQGLDVRLPPKSHFLHVGSPTNTGTGTPHHSPFVEFQLGAVDCTGMNLELETSKPGKLPMQIAIAHLRLTSISADAEMHFEAELTNPKPTGIIHTTGDFGPWQVSDPGESPLAGQYTFDHADLGDIKGIAGILSSTGRYEGTLRDIIVDGQTDTPDFRLSQFNNSFDLRTQFHAIVDGTNGDTWLDPVNATMGQSHISAKGQVVRVLAPDSDGSQHSIGHDISLEINVSQGRIEDFVRLGSHGSTSPLSGDVTVKAALLVPPGQDRVDQRMNLKGQFELNKAQFTSSKVQDRIEELSLRGQGRPNDVKSTDPDTIVSEMHSNFTLAHGTITLPDLAFLVPGAEINLDGTYVLDGGALKFTGTANMQATVSKMVGGWKGFLLKPADRFFKKDGAGTSVAIHVDGTREHPDFGVDIKGVDLKRGLKHTSPERPDQQPDQQSAHPESPQSPYVHPPQPVPPPS
jgi:AsmA-like C-terminal region